ncbi:MAG: PD-(D/E)XK nuclease family protein [Candidatus Methanomethylicaceae archaeon]
MHRHLPEILKMGGVEVKATELKVELKHPNKEIYLSGRVDVLVVDQGGEEVVVEVKSARSVPDAPHRNHVLQLQCYLNYTGINKGIILYWGKSSGEVKAFEVQADPGTMDEVWERCEAVVEGIQRGIPPPKEGTENGWECLFCEHFRECHVGGLENPRPVKEWEIYRGGAADEAAVKSLWEGMMRGEEILVLTDNDEWAAKERLLRDGVPFIAVLAKPPSYDMRWYEKVYEAIGGGESGGRTAQRS